MFRQAKSLAIKNKLNEERKITMKKSIKNTIMIGMAVVMIGTSAITFSYASLNEHREISAPPEFSQSQQGKNGFNENNFERRLPNGENSDRMPDFNNGSQQNSQQNGQKQPPQKEQQPNSSDNSENKTPDGNAPQQSEGNAPQQPQSGQNSQSQQNGSESNSNANSTDTSLESDTAEIELLTSEGEAATAKAMPVMKRNTGAVIVISYIFFAVQIAIILMIIAYLIVSKFNSLSFNQVFPEKKG